MNHSFRQFIGEQDSSEDKATIEKLAALGHAQWMDWAQNLISRHGDDLPQDAVDRWKSYFVSYEELDDEIKEKDRAWARRMLEIARQG